MGFTSIINVDIFLFPTFLTVSLNLLLVPDGDGDGVGGPEQEVVVGVPLRVQAGLDRLRAVRLEHGRRRRLTGMLLTSMLTSCSLLHRDPDKRVGQAEQVPLGQTSGAQNGQPDLVPRLTGACS